MAELVPESKPPCGLYVTTQPFESAPESIPAGRLIKFHNHSSEGTATIALPANNQHNRWSFGPETIAVDSPEFLASLRALKAEGLWRLREHFHPNAGQVVRKNAVVQLGYNRAAEPILFFPIPIDGANAYGFGDRGTRIPQAIYDLLEPLDVSGPVTTRKLH